MLRQTIFSLLMDQTRPKDTTTTKTEAAAAAATTTTTKKYQNETTPSSPSISNSYHVSIGQRALRIVLLDLPLFIIFFMYTACCWIGYVQVQYLLPQIQSLVFDKNNRPLEEMTYYKRHCTIHDVTTTNGSDLFLSPTCTVSDAYEHHLKHGFTVFKNVLHEQTATNLRTYILQQNSVLKEQEKIYVIENEHRFSFGLSTVEPTVLQAIKEVATSKLLRPTIEAILGPNPSMIEMTAITSTYGAKSQRWHPDIIPKASVMNYGRTFTPSYSVFIQLQNTTTKMGATGACPGTHYCSIGPKQFCNASGFQVVDNDGIWHIGDALLMNMNSYHQGAAHTEPMSNSERVMFIITFVPRPVDRAESRQLSQGFSYSLRWDMYGHTLYDLENPDTIMKQPWVTLRSLGLYKLPNTTWGIDFISSTCMRIANDDHGYKIEDLEKWIEYGGFSFLPNWLEGTVHIEKGESWYIYYTRTLANITQFIKLCSIIGIVCYVKLSTSSSLSLSSSSWTWPLFINPTRTSKNTNNKEQLRHAIVRVSVIGLLVYLMFVYAKHVVDTSYWAIDIRTNRRYNASGTGTVPYNQQLAASRHKNDTTTTITTTKSTESTFPTRYDVLIETRYGLNHLAMYNDFISKGHPGNRLYNELLRICTTSGKYIHSIKQQHSSLFVLHIETMAELIVHTITSSGSTTSNNLLLLHHHHNYAGRFLYQNPNNGYWLWMSVEESIQYTTNELVKQLYPVLQVVFQQLRFLQSNNTYGLFRTFTMVQKHSNVYLEYLEKKVLSSFFTNNNQNTNNKQQIHSNTVATITTTTTTTFVPSISLAVSKQIKHLKIRRHARQQQQLQHEQQEQLYRTNSQQRFITTTKAAAAAAAVTTTTKPNNKPTNQNKRHYSAINADSSSRNDISENDNDTNYEEEQAILQWSWLSSGDTVEVYDENDGYWYYGTIESILPSCQCTVRYTNGQSNDQPLDLSYDLRRPVSSLSQPIVHK